ncbi:jg4635 [Pararge aegeria aegeria]|uniref:Jg4635 protein n=1 Tax=Pararge aegeria aegeria TaxID=348720 RepID=A0A8S4RMB5_9NEOP|nr:jg4635 [Pararge aegeria aegeria]
MEVIEDGNIMDRIPILLQRDLEYYQNNQTVLSENVCCGVVGGRLDFPRSASFAAVKIVLWLEEEFSIAFKQGSGMFVSIGEDKVDGVAKTSDPDKFAQLATKSSDSLLEHLHVLAQEALDHADLPVLTATLGAAALLKNSLYCYVQHVEDAGNTDRHSLLLACYKRYATMSEAVGERVLDLHNRVLSLYILQDSGGRPIDDLSNNVPEAGTPSVQGWWLYMNGSKKDLWDTVPPRMAQRIFAGMLNETLTILTVRYCQTNTTESTTPLLINDILNILLCVGQLLPATCNNGSDLAGLEEAKQSRDVRDVHAKCNELFKCMVYRGSALHFLHQAFTEQEDTKFSKDTPYPWFTFINPNLFDCGDDKNAKTTQELSTKTALCLELMVLLAQPQPSWSLVVKVLMMRNCHLLRMLLINAISNMSKDNSRWPADGLWYNVEGCKQKCEGFLCTADGFCRFKGDCNAGEEYARAVGALTYILATIGSKSDVKSTLCYALEVSGRDWASCLDKRQVWCDRRPPWLAGLLAVAGTLLQYIPSVLVHAVQTGASMYQTMSLCLTCISRTLDCIPRCFINACSTLENTLPSNINPVGGSILLQMLITVAYEELQKWAQKEVVKEKSVSNGEAHDMNIKHRQRPKQVRISSMNRTTTSSSASFDGSHSAPSSIALAIAEALCSIDEDHKHTSEIEDLVIQTKKTYSVSDNFGLEDFPEFAEFFEEGNVPASDAERASDAAALTTQILMTSAGRDSLRILAVASYHPTDKDMQSDLVFRCDVA